MTEFQDQQELKKQVLIVALALCFRTDETYLLVEQIHTNRFTPLEDYSRYCIELLADYGLTEYHKPAQTGWQNEEILLVKSPLKPGESLDDFVYKNSEKTIDLTKKSPSMSVHLKNFYREVMCCECIEYANYYAEKSGGKLVGSNYKNALLNLLLLEISPEKMNSLLWRSIKNYATEKNQKIKLIDFDSILSTAFNDYVKHRRLNIDIKEYHRPSGLGLSMLSKVLELYLALINDL